MCGSSRLLGSLFWAFETVTSDCGQTLAAGVLMSLCRTAVLCSVEFNRAEPAYAQYTYLDQVPSLCFRENYGVPRE